MPSFPDSILELAQAYRTGAVSPVEVTRDCLDRIAALNPQLNAFITVMPETAFEQARQAEAEIRRGEWRSPLQGVPIGLKDIIDTAGVRTTAASAVFQDRIPAQDADVVRQLNAAGAVLIGKHNLHEFAYGGSSLISYFGEVHNPWKMEHIAGGSSGGSAAAVAAALGYGAIGTDTAGSIREPSALCGLAGLKPTYGRVSARGVVPLSTSLDHVGPMARSVADVAVLLQAIADPTARNSSGAIVPVPEYAEAMKRAPRELRVGIPREYFFADLDAEVTAAVGQAIAVMEPLVAEVQEIALPGENKRPLQSYEAYLYHAQFLGDFAAFYHPETLRRILAGRAMEWAGYTQSMLELKAGRSKIAEVFAQVDLLVTPTVPVPAPAIAEFKLNPEEQRPRELRLLRNTQSFNAWGLPAISVPCGFTGAGLPIGLQIAGPHWGEVPVLRLAFAYEQATQWHRMRPQGIGSA